MRLRFIPTAPRILRFRDSTPEGVVALVGGATLALVPQLTGARKRGRSHWLPHAAIGAIEMGMALLTKPEAPRKRRRRWLAALPI